VLLKVFPWLNKILFYCIVYSSGPYPEPYLFINELGSGIHAIDLLTHAKTGVIRELKKNRGMAINTVEMKIYFGNGSSISRANLDGTGVEVFLQTDADVWKISVDWIGGRLFGVNNPYSSRVSHIFVVYLDDKDRRIVTTRRSRKYDIAVDPTLG
jgi:hypothetical protein